MVHFDDIHFGHGLERNQTKNSCRKSIKSSHEPYYLAEGDLVPLQVNEALEKVSSQTDFLCSVKFLNT